MFAHTLAPLPATADAPAPRDWPAPQRLVLVEREPVDAFKPLLEASRRDLLAAAWRARAGSSIDTSDLPDEGDLAAAEYSVSLTMQLAARDTRLLHEIEGALERIDEGTFGLCDECGGEISPGRLEARPTTTLCIDCQEDEERRKKRSFG